MHDSAAHTESLAEMLNDSSIDRLLAIDPSWNVIAWNRTCELMTGFPREEVVGRHLFEVFPGIAEDPEAMQAFRDAFHGRKSFLPSNALSFNRQYIENHYIPLLNAEREVIGVMNLMHDVAHRIKVERQLVRLNTVLEKKYEELEKANRDLSTFTYIAGHNLKDPIKHVYTALELIARKEGGNLSNTSRGSLRKMQASLNRMNLLLDDILAISRIANYNHPPEPVDLNQVLAEELESMSSKLNSRCATVQSSELPSVSGSAELLRYLFHHLIDNALKFQPEDGQPVVTIAANTITMETAGKPTEYAEISVTDNGIGFPADQATRIFNMFERLDENRYHGSGVGLAICKKILDYHGGLITAESQSGTGSVFKCFFPVPSGE